METALTILLILFGLSLLVYLFCHLYLKSFIDDSPVTKKWHGIENLTKTTSLFLFLLTLINLFYLYF